MSFQSLNQPNLVTDLIGLLLQTPGMYWNKLKMQSAISAIGGKSDKDSKKKKGYTSAVGRYSYLNKVWKPVHRICFLDPHIIKNEKELFKVLLRATRSLRTSRSLTGCVFPRR